MNKLLSPLAAGFLAACLSSAFAAAVNPRDDLVLWHGHPAKDWESEAFPLGNGRLGCMIFGGVGQDRIQFNVDSLWTGDENPSGDYGTMGAYQNFGDVFISLDRGSSNTVEASQYRRELDLSRAVHRVTYTSGEVQFSRETFCSHPAGVLVSRLTANKPGQYSGSITLKDAHNAATQTEVGRRLRFVGALPNGLKYAAQLHVQNSGGGRILLPLPNRGILGCMLGLFHNIPKRIRESEACDYERREEAISLAFGRGGDGGSGRGP